ncbi:MAG TPA: cation transporter, partial [Clostridia bacterium]|nr:cation transporter [Clostridia bacterium]
GVISSHHTHIWSLDSEHHVLSTHLVLDKSLSLDQVIEIKRQAREKIDYLKIEHITIEVDFEDDDCGLQ